MDTPLIHQVVNTALLTALLVAQFLNREKGPGLTKRARRRTAYARDAVLYGLRKAKVENGKNPIEAAERHAVAHFQMLDLADNKKRDYSDGEIHLAVHSALEQVTRG